MMKKFFAVVRLAALSGLAFSLLEACDPPKPVAQVCETDNECETGLICVEKACTEYFSCALREKGCTGECEGKATGAACLVSAECKAGDACVEGKCATAGKCPTGEFCAATDTGSACRTLGCRVASDCNGQVCIDSKCEDAPTTVPESCEIANLATTFSREATGIKVLAVAYKNNEVIPYLKPTSIATTGGNFTADSAAGTISGKADAPAGGGVDTVTASFGNVTCSKPFTLAANFVGSRVVLYTNSVTGGVGAVNGLTDAHISYFDAAGLPLATAVAETPANSGVYVLTANLGAAPVGIHIVHPSYSAATYYYGAGATSMDIALPLEKLAETTGFGGKPDFGDFDKEFTDLTKAEIKGLYASGSLPLSSLLNFSLDLFAGDLAPKNIDASILTGGGAVGACTPVNNATANQYGKACTDDASCNTGGATGLTCDKDDKVCTATAPLPRALFASINEKGLIGPNCDAVVVRSLAGRRTAWSIGTKVPLSKVTGFASLLSSGTSGLDIGKILGAALPLLDNFAFGSDKITPPTLNNHPITDWNTFREKNAAGLSGDNNFGFATIRPSRRLKFTENFKNTGMIANDFYAGAPATEKLNGVVTLITTISPAYGLVPIGFGAGFDSNGDGTFDTLPNTDPTVFVPNAIHARYAAPAKELSDNEIIAVTVGTNLTDLTREVSLSASTRLKGVVSRNTTTGIGFKDSTLPSLTSAVQGVVFPALPTYVPGPTGPSGTLTLPVMSKEASTVAADAVVLRISRDTVALTWNVIINPAAIGSSAIVLPTRGLQGGDTIISNDTGEGQLVMATTALRFGEGFSFDNSFSPKSPKDLNALAGEVSSFSLYYARVNRQ